MDTFENVFRELAAILRPFAGRLVTVRDEPGDLYLESPRPRENGQPLFFGAVKEGKRYVSYHLMPVYVNPDLLDELSPALRKRMQGKSCFNFRKHDPKLYEELTELTQRGFERWQADGRL